MNKYIILCMVVILLSISTVSADVLSASASRDIETQNLTAGNSTDITVTIINNVSQALSLQENLPSGWTLTRISDDASNFKPSTNEWIWFNVGAGVIKTVTYRLNVPLNATSGTYNINGSISNASGIIAAVGGENIIYVLPETTFSISGYKINDTNGNGIWNTGEQGIEGWNITLKNATNGAVITNVLTDNNGFYEFSDLEPCTYQVKEETESGWINTSAILKNITILDSDIINQNFTNYRLSVTQTFDTGAGSYPSISGVHNGTITLNQTLTLHRLYTYPTSGTGGHSEYAAFYYPDGSMVAGGSWNGYRSDWNNITFTPFTLEAGVAYNYTIRTGSYPQIIHDCRYSNDMGTVTGDEFTDANGRKYRDWIPAIKLE